MPIMLEIATPKKLILKEEVDYVFANGTFGEFGVLPEHAPYIVLLKFGKLRYKKGGKESILVVSPGIMEVFNDNVKVLVRACEFPEEIDVDRAKRALLRAKKRLESKEENIDFERAKAALERATIRIEVAGG